MAKRPGSQPPPEEDEGPSESFEVTCEPKLVEYLLDLKKMQGFGGSKSAIARNFIWKEVNRLIETKRLKDR